MANYNVTGFLCFLKDCQRIYLNSLQNPRYGTCVKMRVPSFGYPFPECALICIPGSLTTPKNMRLRFILTQKEILSILSSNNVVNLLLYILILFWISLLNNSNRDLNFSSKNIIAIEWLTIMSLAQANILAFCVS